MGCLCFKATFEANYWLGEELGRGHFAKVCVCVNKANENQYAVKIIDKEHLGDRALLDAEVEILQKVGKHPYVLHMVDIFEDEKNFYIVTELCKGGDLFNRIVEEGNVSEKMTALFLSNLGLALQHIHQHGVIHRDLKPENILCADNSGTDIKLADFGLSKLMREDQTTMQTICGTWAYCAPEIIARKPYGATVDIWTLGVLMYILLAGYHPFDVYGDMPEPQLLRKIQNVDFCFDDEVWDSVSPDAKLIIEKLMVKDPKRRMTLEEFLNHEWVKGYTAKDVANEKRLQNLKNFNAIRKKFVAVIGAKKCANVIQQKLDNMRKGGNGKAAISPFQKKVIKEPVARQE